MDGRPLGPQGPSDRTRPTGRLVRPTPSDLHVWQCATSTVLTRRIVLSRPPLAQQVGNRLRLAVPGEHALAISDDPIRTLHGCEIGKVPDMVSNDRLDAREHVEVGRDEIALELFAPH